MNKIVQSANTLLSEIKKNQYLARQTKIIFSTND